MSAETKAAGAVTTANADVVGINIDLAPLSLFSLTESDNSNFGGGTPAGELQAEEGVVSDASDDIVNDRSDAIEIKNDSVVFDDEAEEGAATDGAAPFGALSCPSGMPPSLEVRLATDGAAAVFIAPKVEGEFEVHLRDLHDWEKKYRSPVDPTDRGLRALLEAAKTPGALPPVSVIKVGNRLVVVDGAARLAALRQQHQDDFDVLVRAVMFDGSESDALCQQLLEKMCSIGLAPLERARLASYGFETLDLQKTSYAVLIGVTNSKLTRLLTTAAVDAQAPQFFALLKNPIKATEAYGYDIGKALMAAEKADRDRPPRGKKPSAAAKLFTCCANLLEGEERFDPAAALAKLGINTGTKPAKVTKPRDELPRRVETLSSEPIVMGDREIGALEILTDHVARARLPEKLLKLPLAEYDQVSEAWLETMRGYFDQHRPKA